MSITLDYDLLGKVQHVCSQSLWHIEDSLYSDKVKIFILAELENVATIEESIVNSTSGNVVIEKGDEGAYFKEEHRLYSEVDI